MYCPEIILEPEISSRHGVFLAIVCLEGADCGRTLDSLLTRVEEEVRSMYRLEDLRNDPRVRALRDFYWKIDIDPTKQRPASEALVRRVLRGGSIPRINCAVDAGNIVSMKTLVPIGIYDLAKLSPPIRMRYSRDGELFKPIGRKPERLRERQIVLADIERIVHVYPYRDGEETKVDSTSRDLLVVAGGVPGLSRDVVVHAAREVARLIVEQCGGTQVSEVKTVP